MNQSEKNQIAIYLSYMCEYYTKNLSKPALQMMVEDLSDLSFTKVEQALRDYRRDPKNTHFPLPAKIREIINPTQSTDGMANEAASRIRQAISNFGWPNPEQARTFIGEVGWKIVERCGGWQYVCENHGVDLNPLTFHAQARDLAKAIVESDKLGIHDEPVMLPSTNKEQISQVISQLVQIKTLEGK